MKHEAATSLSEHLLIRSKLERPPMPGRLVARPRLAERLDKKAGARVTLISAAFGSELAVRLGLVEWVAHFA